MTGSFGKVFLVRDKANKTVHALKVVLPVLCCPSIPSSFLSFFLPSVSPFISFSLLSFVLTYFPYFLLSYLSYSPPALAVRLYLVSYFPPSFSFLSLFLFVYIFHPHLHICISPSIDFLPLLRGHCKPLLDAISLFKVL
jgi:hypothetical protein